MGFWRVASSKREGEGVEFSQIGGPGRVKPALHPALRAASLQRLVLSTQLIALALIVSEILRWISVFFGRESVFSAMTPIRVFLLVLTLRCRSVLQDEKSDPAYRLGFSRAWLGAIALGLSYMEWLPLKDETRLAAVGISRACLAVIMAPILIPDSLRRSLAFSGALCLTIPLGFMLARGTGHPDELFTFATSNVVAVGATWIAAATVNQLREQLVNQFGSYRLVRKIGAGAFGEVWEAAHRHLRRPAAIKLIKPEVNEPDILERFWREAATLGGLECPHTVRLLDYGSSDDGTLYLAMELLRGSTLQGFVDKFGPQCEARVTSLLCQACLSLEEAHERDLIHRDIKPDNLFLCQLGIEPDFIKVLDFGLVKALTSAPSHLTKADQVVGTPDCMSPEQISGRPLDGRTDLYSLGCVAYFLLTGTMVFQTDTAVQSILYHLSMDPEPPSKRLGRPIDPTLEALVLQCLSKDPQDRPATARDLYEQLDRLPRWSRQEAQAWWDRNGGFHG